MKSERVLLLCFAGACGYVHPGAKVNRADDDLTLYRDVAVVRQRVEIDGATSKIAVPDGITADEVLVIAGSAKLRTGELGELIIDTGSAGHHSLVVGYITDKLHWDASYTLTTSPAHERSVLHGTLAIRNTSGVTVHGPAHVVDGELGKSKISRSIPATEGDHDVATRELGTVVLPPGETRVLLVDGSARPMHPVLVYDPIGTQFDNTSAVPLRDPSLGLSEPVSAKVTEGFEIARDRRETAGLPGGTAKLVERRPDGSLVALAETRLFDAATRRSEVDTIAVGTAEGVTGARERRELTDEETRHRLVEEFLITIDNTRPRDVDIVVREHLYRGQTWAVAYQSVPDVHQDGPQAFTMRTRVPAHGQVKILYVVVYTWGT